MRDLPVDSFPDEPKPMGRLQKEGEGPGHGLSDSQLRAAELLVEGMKITEVARQLKVSRKTIWMWRKLSEFDAYQQRLRWDRANEVADLRRRLEQRVVDALLVAVEEGDPDVAVSVARLLWR